ncbi:MAG: NAD(P)H-binding protein [bacterium]
MIAIMGAAGNTGRRAAELLLDAGEKVRVLGRSAERLQDLARRGAEVMTGEATDAGYLATAFRGADAVYTLFPSDMQAPDLRAQQDRIGEATVDAIRKSGVRFVVFLSSLGGELPTGTGPIAGLHAQEERLRSIQGTDALALRPGYFFENTLGSLALIKHQGINGGAIAADLPISMVATRDIGEFAAKALRKRDWKGFTVREILGQRDLSLREVTNILGRRLAKPDLRYVQFGYADFVQALVGMGLPAKTAEGYAEMGRAFNEGKIKSHEGRRTENTTPTRFEEFADRLVPVYESV